MMRAARDGISAEIENMTLEEELKWLASQEISDPFLKRLRDRAAQQAAVDSAYGQKFHVRGRLSGSDGRSAELISIWIVLHGTDAPRFVTAFPD